VAVVAVVSAVAAFWITSHADFLVHPTLLGIQKADFILGPVFVGLYWLRVRPASRFGPRLIAFGLVAVGVLALENAELDAASKESMDELAGST
jgi:hypothetical protein